LLIPHMRSGQQGDIKKSRQPVCNSEFKGSCLHSEFKATMTPEACDHTLVLGKPLEPPPLPLSNN
jgi:hypothetical protein